MELRRRYDGPLVARSDIPAEPLERRTDIKPRMATLGQVLFSNAKQLLINIFSMVRRILCISVSILVKTSTVKLMVTVSQSFGPNVLSTHLDNFSGVQEPILPVLYHDYYQWVSIVLLLQAISFHLPFRLWSKYSFLIARVDNPEI
ncbi:hypothetical protein TNIN_7361 [Trichonephila inaurata madagascariensis]|uniref:Uncharacterized protein n=1 Tax=Trichonephila inaurata madagascariensis TaxID=2747483 RepID=A0A8X7BRC7_9ARAC|nr:hypothetical protein TNIN_7361 [Trichonephila inaurata madagascariensis]